MRVTPLRPDTTVGVRLFMVDVVPIPRWPAQCHTKALQQCGYATCQVVRNLLANRTILRLINTTLRWLTHIVSNNSSTLPLLLLPQHMAVPSAATAHVCAVPAEMPKIPISPVAVGSELGLTVVLSPSSPTVTKVQRG
jgi:hypothetical protein